MQGFPDSCVANIISFTSPLDACRLAAVSTKWRRVAEFDIVWQRFLPEEFQEILDRAVDFVGYSSFKELFFRLCEPLLIDKEYRMLQLNRSNGKVFARRSADGLVFYCAHRGVVDVDLIGTSGLSSERWNHLQLGGRAPKAFLFSCISIVRFASEFKVFGDIVDTRMLSPKTYYVVRLIFRITSNSIGLDVNELVVIIAQCGVECRKRASLKQRNLLGLDPMGWDPYDSAEMAEYREDGWMQLEIGRFYRDSSRHNGNRPEDWRITFRLIDEMPDSVGGLILLGIEACPLN